MDEPWKTLTEIFEDQLTAFVKSKIEHIQGMVSVKGWFICNISIALYIILCIYSAIMYKNNCMVYFQLQMHMQSW